VNVGILGAGQLAARDLGHAPSYFAPEIEPATAAVGAAVKAAYADLDAVRAWARTVDVVTFEFENVPTETALAVADVTRVFPHPAALAVAQDRVEEKRIFRAIGADVARYYPVDHRADLDVAAQVVGLPALLKARRLGYDGRGQILLDDVTNLDTAFAAIGERPAVLEERIRFDDEISVLAVRSISGEIRLWALTENVHHHGILELSRAPARAASRVERDAHELVHALLVELDYTGVLAVELFRVGDRIIVNEMAPRVHNSGHWTLDGAVTSQFENHLRAGLGMPLGDTALRAPTGMRNLLGAPPDLAALPKDVAVHIYGKEPRPGRKVGHLTVSAATPEALEERLATLEAALRPAHRPSTTPQGGRPPRRSSV